MAKSCTPRKLRELYEEVYDAAPGPNLTEGRQRDSIDEAIRELLDMPAVKAGDLL